MKPVLYIAIIILYFSSFTKAQNIEHLSKVEDTLNSIAARIPNKLHDFERLSLNEEFKNVLLKALEEDGSMDFPFDSLNNVSVLTATDNSFRIMTWYIPLPDGTFEFFGFFQAKDERLETLNLYSLSDNVEASDELIYKQLTFDNWHGAYYYRLIHTRHNREDYYTLLGWRSDNMLTRKRIIEPLRLAAKGRPVFGVPLFTYEDNRYRRVVFEYSANINMFMDYERHSLFETRRSHYMIVFDRVEPSHPKLKGHYQFYFPETNIIDAFIFENGRWVFYPEVDARNPSD